MPPGNPGRRGESIERANRAEPVDLTRPRAYRHVPPNQIGDPALAQKAVVRAYDAAGALLDEASP